MCHKKLLQKLLVNPSTGLCYHKECTSLSIGVELMSTPAFPHYFLLLASIDNIAKQTSLVCYLATSYAVNRSFAIADDLGEVSAKAQIQSVFFDNLGLMLAAVLNIYHAEKQSKDQLKEKVADYGDSKTQEASKRQLLEAVGFQQRGRIIMLQSLKFELYVI